MKRILLLIAIFACSEKEEVVPSVSTTTDSFCVYMKDPAGTNAQDIGKERLWRFTNCVDDPDYFILTNTYKGYKTTDCNCRSIF